MRPSSSIEMLTNDPPAVNTVLSSLQTSTPLPDFKLILDALSDYRTKTGKELIDHPLATELLRYDTVDAVLAIVQDQARAFQSFNDGDQELTKWTSQFVQVLFAFFGTLGEGDVRLVCYFSRVQFVETSRAF